MTEEALKRINIINDIEKFTILVKNLEMSIHIINSLSDKDGFVISFKNNLEI